MNIKIRSAIRHFFPNPSFTLVYSEAIANALDAGATQIVIDIKIKSFLDPQSLHLCISDNGAGFTDENFKRFSYLMDAKDKQHKGLGRLVFLEYFKSASFKSVFEKCKCRKFSFNDSFSGKSQIEDVAQEVDRGTTIEFGECSSARFNSYGDLRPSTIKQQLLAEFLPILIERKRTGKRFDVAVRLNVQQPNPDQDFLSSEEHLVPEDLPDFESVSLDVPGLDLLNSHCRMTFAVKTVDPRFHYVKTALVVDGRSVSFPLLKNDSIPQDAMAIFLLESDYFASKTDDSRKDLVLKYEERTAIELAFREKVAQVLTDKLPVIAERNQTTAQELRDRFPHLDGLFDENTAGIIDYEKAVRQAQERFFKEQKDILEATDMSEEQYCRSMNHAARVLAEYVLYREKMISKVESLRKDDPEASIHNLILPKGSLVRQQDLFSDRYTNNAWMLDDKYMSYQYILSDENIKTLIESVATDEERAASDLRPDLALVFSGDINNPAQKVDVVVVEMKKRDTVHLRTMDTIAQLRQRARRLLAYYPDRIQRMWFYGLVDFDKESELEMRDAWTPLFSSGNAYYRNELMTPCDAELNPIGHTRYPVSLTMLSFDAFFKDARLRNHAFLQILKDGMRERSSR